MSNQSQRYSYRIRISLYKTALLETKKSVIINTTLILSSVSQRKFAVFINESNSVCILHGDIYIWMSFQRFFLIDNKRAYIGFQSCYPIKSAPLFLRQWRHQQKERLKIVSYFTSLCFLISSFCETTVCSMNHEILSLAPYHNSRILAGK